jgi:hypothetical protein
LNKFAALPEPKIKIPKSPLKAPFKDINEARKNLTPSKLVTPSILPDTSNQSVGKVSKVVSKQLPKEIPGFEILDEKGKRKQPPSSQPTTPTAPSRKVMNRYVKSLTTPPVSPMKAKLQSKLKARSVSSSPPSSVPSSPVKAKVQSISPSPQRTPPTSVPLSPVKAKIDDTSLTLQEQSLLKNQLIQRIDDKIKNIRDKYGETGDPSKDNKLKFQKLRNKKALVQNESEKILNRQKYTKHFSKANITPEQQKQLFDKKLTELKDRYILAKGTGKPSKENKHKKHNQDIKNQILDLEKNWNGDKSLFTMSEYTKHF